MTMTLQAVRNAVQQVLVSDDAAVEEGKETGTTTVCEKRTRDNGCKESENPRHPSPLSPFLFY